ncbi:MAG: S26 family signal peptidase [Candidatus Thermoplasmatota archaeon]|nr:S26 family signal peptidase [Candidatus Thermoplasmatota archaeon]
MLKKVLPVVKDVLTAVIVILIIVAAMFAYTGVWPPMVVIESGSMMHDDSSYGKIGAIDPGDFTFVKKVNGRNDVITYYQGEKTGYKTYSDYGDVIVYVKNGVGGTPVIHRAMCWVEVNITDNETFYDVPELDYYHLSAITIAELNLHNYNPNVNHSGFLTKGDANNGCDQDSSAGIEDELGRKVGIVKLEWIIGKARGEIPWFGGIKLSVDDWSGGTNNAGNVAQDCWVMLGISILILFTLPIAADYSFQLLSLKKQEKKKKRKIELSGLRKVKYTIFRK